MDILKIYWYFISKFWFNLLIICYLIHLHILALYWSWSRFTISFLLNSRIYFYWSVAIYFMHIGTGVSVHCWHWQRLQFITAGVLFLQAKTKRKRRSIYIYVLLLISAYWAFSSITIFLLIHLTVHFHYLAVTWIGSILNLYCRLGFRFTLSRLWVT